MKKRLAAGLAVVAIGAGAAGVPAASAQPVQNGLVNVNVSNNQILNRNNVGVGVAANVAANVCGVPVSVAVLSVQATGGFSTTCSTDSGPATVTITQ